MSRKKEEQAQLELEQEQISRIKLPRGKQTFGVVEKRLGASRMSVRCMDAKTRICRIPGRMKKKIWLRMNDVVLVAPWDFQSDQKGDITWRYDRGNLRELREKGYLDMLV